MDPFVALADPVRRGLLVMLSRGPARVVDLTSEQSISRPAVSRHLRVLSEAGLVTAEDRGRERHYRLQPDGLAPVVDWLATLQQRPRFDESVLDGLDLEIRRTGRDRRTTRAAHPSQEDTA